MELVDDWLSKNPHWATWHFVNSIAEKVIKQIWRVFVPTMTTGSLFFFTLNPEFWRFKANCKARYSRLISNINIVMSVLYFASYWKPHVPWRPRNNWGECLCTLSDPRTRTSINWSTPSPSPHPLLPTPTHISFATLGTIGCKANKLRSLRDVECKRLIDQQENKVAFSFYQQEQQPI